MNETRGSLWTIAELGERVAQALEGPGYVGVANGRVRDVPDLRTIRYYTTLGLLDRPAEMRGRTALYGHRHLLQLVAIKRLQARGLSLAAVQERVVGLSNAALRRLSAVESPVQAEGVAGDLEGPDPHAPASSSAGARAESFWRTTPSIEITLGSGVRLSIEAERALNEDDLRSVRLAAAPLIEILKLRGLVANGPAPSPEGDAR
jgi:hypothetical protein